MQPDPATAAGLISKAREDLAVVELAVNQLTLSDAVVGFHAQQAVEKAMKAVLASVGVQFPFTHDLTKLVELLEASGFVLDAAIRDARRLTPFAVAFRYGDSDDIGVERAALVSDVALVLDWASDKVAATAG